MTTPDTILDFWFADEARARWFASTPAFDRYVAERFAPELEAAARGELSSWAATARGALALVIVLDQFPLHMFRDRPESFATEAQAREEAVRAIDAGLDRELDGPGRAFLYMPLMHSESLADQDRSVALYQAAGLEDNLKWARHHRELIRRFGRFPHRNAILGRESSPEERAYLASKEAFLG